MTYEQWIAEMNKGRYSSEDNPLEKEEYKIPASVPETRTSKVLSENKLDNSAAKKTI